MIRQLPPLVREYGASVVLLVTRKMPRLVEALELAFGSDTIVVTDLSIPFAYQDVEGAKVAVIDDVVNVGSTVTNAQNAAYACGAANVAVFALARRESSPDLADVRYAHKSPLVESEYRRLVSDVPRALTSISKPYDLDYPILTCRLAIPFATAQQLMLALEEQYGSNAVHIIAGNSDNRKLKRLAVDLVGSAYSMRKLRFYLNEETGECNVVPMAIGFPGQAIDKASLSFVLTEEARSVIEKGPKSLLDWRSGAVYRSELFAASLQLGLAELRQLSHLLIPRSEEPFSVYDAAYVFGPTLARRLANLTLEYLATVGPAEMPVEEIATPSVSPFFTHFLTAEFSTKVVARAGSRDIADVFRSLFDQVAEDVGASNPDAYAATWPLTREEILKEPYRRLRIGPTFVDIVQFLRRECPTENRPCAASLADYWHTASRLLDYSIDSGGVVPALANYENSTYRIYRKGENALRDEVVSRAVVAWATCGPMSLTRFTKISAILGFSDAVPKAVDLHGLKRGTVAALPKTCLDSDSPELALYLLKTGKVKKVHGEDDPDGI